MLKACSISKSINRQAINNTIQIGTITTSVGFTLMYIAFAYTLNKINKDYLIS